MGPLPSVVGPEIRLVKNDLPCTPRARTAGWRKSQEYVTRGFPRGPVAKIPHSQGSGGRGTIPGQGTRFLVPQLKIQHAAKNIERPSCRSQRIFFKKCVTSQLVLQKTEGTVWREGRAETSQCVGRSGGLSHGETWFLLPDRWGARPHTRIYTHACTYTHT